ncbi:hypothetical protein [Methylobacterium indicum]|uniref:Uncharacterized protein n=1 Tax=Methylobacterium indicum TaxID=1775910 RepID=A0ABR5HGX7_9HYPH|nr:hypothetical protein [Methylobacterium indicum]KMO17598.1 hypothetical protein QR78_16930 [Methylobacterium indicum]KMO25809.1 hypothetical protein QR79_05625 [Methylobacterium indicum]
MLRKPSLSPRRLASVAAITLALATLANAAEASPRQNRAEACSRARSDGEREGLGCWRLRHEAGRGQRIHGGAAVADFYATVPAERESADAKADQRRRDWARARARGTMAGSE